jgi:hypothetical protein
MKNKKFYRGYQIRVSEFASKALNKHGFGTVAHLPAGDNSIRMTVDTMADFKLNVMLAAVHAYSIEDHNAYSHLSALLGLAWTTSVVSIIKGAAE